MRSRAPASVACLHHSTSVYSGQGSTAQGFSPSRRTILINLSPRLALVASSKKHGRTCWPGCVYRGRVYQPGGRLVTSGFAPGTARFEAQHLEHRRGSVPAHHPSNRSQKLQGALVQRRINRKDEPHLQRLRKLYGGGRCPPVLALGLLLVARDAVCVHAGAAMDSSLTTLLVVPVRRWCRRQRWRRRRRRPRRYTKLHLLLERQRRAPPRDAARPHSWRRRAIALLVLPPHCYHALLLSRGLWR